MDKKEFDIVILGGGIASTLLTISLLKKSPNFKILIIEKASEFPVKVGESTSDITALFLRRLGIDDILKQHVKKTGLRFLFNESGGKEIEDVSEFSSPTFPGPNNGFQFDRKKFDEQLLKEAEKLGATVFRPATIRSFNFESFKTELKVSFNEEDIEVSSRWFIDASGRSRYINKELNWEDAKTVLNTTAVFAHFSETAAIADWNIPEHQYWKDYAVGHGSDSTIHFMTDYGWWWLIKIDDKTTSIGFVFDKDELNVENVEAHFLNEIKNNPQLNSICEGSSKSKPTVIDKVAYQTKEFVKDGIILLGDSAAFVDPMVSPGIEMICQQIANLEDLLYTDVIEKQYQPKKWVQYNKKFSKGYSDRMEIYKKGYQYMGSYDLMANWLQAGLFAYFGLFVFGAYIFPNRIKKPFTINKIDRIGFKFFLWRLNSIKKKRKQQNRTSKLKPSAVTYSGFSYPKGLLVYGIPFKMFFKFVGRYLRLELKEFSYLFRKK
jgi:flavin-dependent dehydrogenase